MAYTGLAAGNLPKGQTIHSKFGIPVRLFSDSSSNITPGTKEAKKLIETTVYIVDEGSMVPRHISRIMDELLRDLTSNDCPYGGKIFLFGGDFRQILPIQKNASRAQQVDLTLKASNLWNYMGKLFLTTNMRALPEEKEFADFLLKVGNGSLNDENDMITIPEERICSEPLHEVIFRSSILNKQWADLSNCAILAPLNEMVDKWNTVTLDMLPKEGEKIYYSSDSVETQRGQIDSGLFPMEFINSLQPSGYAYDKV